LSDMEVEMKCLKKLMKETAQPFSNNIVTMKVFAVIAALAATASAQVASVYPYPQQMYPGYNPGMQQQMYPGMGYPQMGYPGMGYPGQMGGYMGGYGNFQGYQFSRYDQYGRPVIDSPQHRAGTAPPAIWHVDAPVDGKAQQPTWEQPHYNTYWGSWLFNVDDVDYPYYPGMGYPGQMGGYYGGYPQQGPYYG
jgi:hypothetical protein